MVSPRLSLHPSLPSLLSFLVYLKFGFYLFVCVCVYVCMGASTSRGQKRALDSTELEVQAVTSLEEQQMSLTTQNHLQPLLFCLSLKLPPRSLLHFRLSVNVWPLS